jgi:hypothetical protein
LLVSVFVLCNCHHSQEHSHHIVSFLQFDPLRVVSKISHCASVGTCRQLGQAVEEFAHVYNFHHIILYSASEFELVHEYQVFAFVLLAIAIDQIVQVAVLFQL